MKKITSVLLTVAMLLSMLSVTAWAADNTYVEATANVDYTSKTVTVAVTAAQATTNGKITVGYEADSLTYVDCDVVGTASSVVEGDETVTFGYGTSTKDAIQAQGTVATLTLQINPDASGTTSLTINVEEFNGATSLDETLSLEVSLEKPVLPTIPDTPGTPSDPGTTDPGTTDPGTTQPAVTTSDVTEEGTVVTETTAAIESTTEDGTASASVSKEVADEIVNQAVSNSSDTVVIAPDMGDDVTGTEVSIPADLVADIAEKTDAELRVETPVANVTIPNEGLSGLAEAGGEVSVSAERDGDTVTVTISADGQQVDQVVGGVTVSIPQADCTYSTVAMLVNEDGTTEVIRLSLASSDGQSIKALLDGSATVEIVDNSVSFTDVSDTNWAANAVAFVASHELMKGTGDGIFDPKVSMTRGMLAVVLHNLEYNVEAGSEADFTDVSADKWYTEAVAWAAEKGIVTGYPDGSFHPNDSITREQLAVMLYRYVGSPEVSTDELSFVDADEISGYAKQAIAWAAANGIMQGKGGGVLDPKGTATRAEVAQMLLNLVSSMI